MTPSSKYTVKYVTSTATAGTVTADTGGRRTVSTGSTVILSVPKATTTITVPWWWGPPVKAASTIGPRACRPGPPPCSAPRHSARGW